MQDPCLTFSVLNHQRNHGQYRTTTYPCTEHNRRQAALHERVASASSFSILSLLRGHQKQSRNWVRERQLIVLKS